jgi:Asp-tRNA(Asn)/Glu-tRNA(Gln) amidotransferase A subunit family amidase
MSAQSNDFQVTAGDINLIFPTASELTNKICQRHVSSQDMLETHLKHIATYNPSINAIVTLDEEKELIWFERSGHNPWVTESARSVDVVVNKVLAETYPVDD